MRIPGRRPGNDVAFGSGQAAQVQLAMGVGVQDAERRGVVERQGTGSKFNVGNGKAVLVCGGAGLAKSQAFGGYVRRRAADACRGAFGRKHTGQAEIAYLHRVAHQQQILRLDVAVLYGDRPLAQVVVGGIEIVEALGRVSHVPEQLLQWNARLTSRAALGQPRGKILLSQRHRHNEFRGYQRCELSR